MMSNPSYARIDGRPVSSILRKGHILTLFPVFSSPDSVVNLDLDIGPNPIFKS